MQKKLLIITLLCLLQTNVHAFWPLSNTTFQRYSFGILAVAGGIGTGYHWVTKKLFLKRFEEQAERFKDQAFLLDRYEDASSTLNAYKKYVDIVKLSPQKEEQSKQLVTALVHQFRNTQKTITLYKKTVIERYQELSAHAQEIEKTLLEWKDNSRKALLVEQGPFITKTFTLCLATLEQLIAQLSYVEALFFRQNYADTLTDEQELETYLKDPELFSLRLDKLIRITSDIGEKYPYRTYAAKLELIYAKVSSLKKALEKEQYYSFQKETLDYIKRTHHILGAIKKQIKSSKEFDAECIQYNASQVAVEREKENKHLKQTLAHMSQQIQHREPQ